VKHTNSAIENSKINEPDIIASAHKHPFTDIISEEILNTVTTQINETRHIAKIMYGPNPFTVAHRNPTRTAKAMVNKLCFRNADSSFSTEPVVTY
jgi:hypothetical protein